MIMYVRKLDSVNLFKQMAASKLNGIYSCDVTLISITLMPKVQLDSVRAIFHETCIGVVSSKKNERRRSIDSSHTCTQK